MDQLVKFETAKLAKDKGFNEMCRHFFDGNNKPDSQDGYDYYQNSTTSLTAPTQCLLQKWLRDHHKIHIVLTLQEEKYWAYHIPGLGGTSGYETYEYALEAGLDHALILI